MSEEICLIGDSVAKGVLYDAEAGRYVHGACSFVRQFCDAEHLPLNDHAKFGCTLAKAQKIAERYEETFAGSRATILMLGGNDCDYDWAAVAADPKPDRACNTPPDSFVPGYISLIERIKKNGGHPVLLSMVPVLSRRYYGWITARNGEAGIRDFLLYPEHIEHWNEMYNLSLYGISKQCGVPLIDVRSPLLARRDIGAFYCPDGIHPNRAGHDLLYRSCAEALRQAVEEPVPYVSDL